MQLAGDAPLQRPVTNWVRSSIRFADRLVAASWQHRQYDVVASLVTIIRCGLPPYYGYGYGQLCGRTNNFSICTRAKYVHTVSLLAICVFVSALTRFVISLFLNVKQAANNAVGKVLLVDSLGGEQYTYIYVHMGAWFLGPAPPISGDPS